MTEELKAPHYPVYEILDDGDLKYVFEIYNFLPNTGDTIANVICNEDGKPIRRIYYKVRDRILPCSLKNNESIPVAQPVIHVSLEIDEDIM